MKKGAGMGGSLDKPSSVSGNSMKNMPAANTKNIYKAGSPYNSDKTTPLNMTKSHPLHQGRKITNKYSAYKAN